MIGQTISTTASSRSWVAAGCGVQDENRLNNVGAGDLGIQCLPFSKSKRKSRLREGAYEKRQNPRRSGGGFPYRCLAQCRRGAGEGNRRGGRRQGKGSGQHPVEDG